MADPSSDHEAVELAAFKALSGADYARQRLLHGLAMGTPSVESDAYLIKSRVKAWDSLVLKVQDRRTGKPTYSAGDVRDVVGLRLLALFKNELPLLLRRFLAFVEWSQKEPFSLFYGETLSDCIEEAIIYATSDVHDPHVSLLAEEFSAYGLKLSDEAASVRIDRKPSQYSSIHVVVWANGPKKSFRDRVPVEVQLRTSLEDVWGEIDHRLRYKMRQQGAVEGPESKKFLAIATRHLLVLKQSLDASSSAADLIEEQISGVFEGAENSIRQNQKYVSYDFDKLNHLGLVREIQERVDRVVASLLRLYRQIYDLSGAPTAEFLNHGLKELDTAGSEIKACYDAYRTSPFEDASRDVEVRYRLQMERALCFCWKAILLKSQASPSEDVADSREQTVSLALSESLTQYFLIANDKDMANDAVLAFRIANVLILRGNRELALGKFREAVARLKDSRLPPNHYMRLRIPRQYGFALWEAAERMKRTSMELGDTGFLLTQRRELYLEALAVTLPLHGMEVIDGALDRSTTDNVEENRIVANNILEYVLCFLRVGGDNTTLREMGVTVDRVRQFLAEVAPGDISAIRRVTLADTVRETARWLGDRDLAVAAAIRVLELIDSHDFSVSLPDGSYDEMRRDALSEIADGAGKVAGFPQLW